jgi:MFS family permease
MLARFRRQLSSQGGSVIAFVLLFNSLSWFFIGRVIVNKVANALGEASIESLSLNMAYPVSIIVSGIIGAIALTKVHRIRFFQHWLVLGITASLLLAVPISSSFGAQLTIVVFMGISLGLGIPSCLAYFSESVPIEKRGKAGGLVFLLSSLSVPIISLTMSDTLPFLSVVIFAAWRGWGLLAILAIPQDGCCEEPAERRDISLASVLRDRAFLLYFIAWFMFSLVDSFQSAIFVGEEYDKILSFVPLIEPAIAGISAPVAGILSDWIGRKRVMIFGFVSLGIAYAILGIAKQIWPSWFIHFFFFHIFVNGLAIGMLWLLFTIVLWGDMSRYGSEKYYAIGETPLFLTQAISPLLRVGAGIGIGDPLIPETSAFSLAAFFLFIAVIPLLYAPETLPEKKIQERQIQMYTKEALKVKQKTEQKSKKNQD